MNVFLTLCAAGLKFNEALALTWLRLFINRHSVQIFFQTSFGFPRILLEELSCTNQSGDDMSRGLNHLMLCHWIRSGH